MKGGGNYTHKHLFLGERQSRQFLGDFGGQGEAALRHTHDQVHCDDELVHGELIVPVLVGDVPNHLEMLLGEA